MVSKNPSSGLRRSTDSSFGSYDTTTVLNRSDGEPNCANLQREMLGGHLRVLAASWRRVLAYRDVVVLPPEFMGTDRLGWSVNSYGAHVRDLADLTHRRVNAMLTSAEPLILRRWNPAEAARNGKYDSADPRIVSYSLARKFGELADCLENLGTSQWDISAVMVDGVEVTVQSLAQAAVGHIENHHHEAEKALDLDSVDI